MPNAATLLEVWERGLRQPLQHKVFGLLQTALPGFGPEALRRLTIGARDACLLDLRSRLFGPTFDIVSACPRCGERLEAALDASALRPPRADAAPINEALSAAGYTLRIRVPAVEDLLALPEGCDETQARRFLIERCLLESTDADGAPAAVDDVPEDALRAAARRMADIDPQADIVLAFECPRCRAGFEHVFDIAGFLVKEVHAWAQRMLRDIHALARVYGWSEASILALSPVRRQIYLDIVQ